MKKNEKIIILKQYRNYLLYLKGTELQSKPKQKEKEKQKVLVLKKPFYGRDLVVG